MFLKLPIKLVFVITVLVLSIATPGMSQEEDATEVNNIYKIGAGKLLVKQFFLGYERKISNHFSLNSQLGLLGKAFYLETLSEMNGINGSGHIRTEKTPSSQFFNKRTSTKFGGQINLEPRYYPFGFDNKFFIGARVGYQYADFGNDLEVVFYEDVLGGRLTSKVLDLKQNSYFYGGTIGANFIFKRKVALEFYLLIARRYSKLINPKTIEVITNPSGPTYSDFKNNHLNSIHRIHFEFGVYVGLCR